MGILGGYTCNQRLLRQWDAWRGLISSFGDSFSRQPLDDVCKMNASVDKLELQLPASDSCGSASTTVGV